MNENDPNVLAYVRSYQGENVLVVLNMSKAAQKVSLDLAAKGLQGSSANTLIASPAAPAQVNVSDIQLEPFGAIVAKLQ